MRHVLSADMKMTNRKVVYQYIHENHGRPFSRASVSRITTISAPTVLKIISFFEERGLLTPLGIADNNEPGRKPNMLQFNPNAAYALGATYDSKILELSLINLNYETVKNMRCEVKEDVSTLISNTLGKKVSEFLSGEAYKPILGMGISLPAVVDTNNISIRVQSAPSLQGHFLPESLLKECESLEQEINMPVCLENDVNCAALAEYHLRYPSENDDLVFLMLGGGFGAGFILDGKLRRGRRFSCGEIGYMTYDTAFQLSGEKLGYLEWRLYRYTLDRYGIDILQSEGPFPYEVIEHLAKEIALVIANLSNALDICSFVIGGRVFEKLGFTLIDRVNQHLKALVLRDVFLTTPFCSDACAKGAASIIIWNQLDNFLSDDFKPRLF